MKPLLIVGTRWSVDQFLDRAYYFFIIYLFGRGYTKIFI